MARITKAMKWARVKELATKIWSQNSEKIRYGYTGREFICLGYHGAYATSIVKELDGTIDWESYYAGQKEKLTVGVADEALALMEKLAAEGFQKAWDSHLKDCGVCSKPYTQNLPKV
jgi:hypothetical protein